jgi:hypothetical protein
LTTLQDVAKKKGWPCWEEKVSCGKWGLGAARAAAAASFCPWGVALLRGASSQSLTVAQMRRQSKQ